MQIHQTKPHRTPTTKLARWSKPWPTTGTGTPTYSTGRAFGLLVCLITVLATAPSIQAANGTWTNLLGSGGTNLVSGDASGSWANATNWNNGVIADGADNTADFSTLDITTTTNSIVTFVF